MFDLMFFVRTLVVTFLIVALMQIRMGQNTIEAHAAHFIRTSTLMEPLHKTAEGGVKVVRDSLSWLSRQIQAQVKKVRGGQDEPGTRAQGLKLKRSSKVEEEAQD